MADEEKTISDELVVTKYKTAGDVVNSKWIRRGLRAGHPFAIIRLAIFLSHAAFAFTFSSCGTVVAT